MKIIYNSILPFKGYKAFTFLYYIFVRYGTILKDDDINHEAIHWEQQKELLIIGFYVLYGLMYLYWLLYFTLHGNFDKIWNKSYHRIAFEREAYNNEDDLEYLSKRKRFAWFHAS